MRNIRNPLNDGMRNIRNPLNELFTVFCCYVYGKVAVVYGKLFLPSLFFGTDGQSLCGNCESPFSKVSKPKMQ